MTKLGKELIQSANEALEIAKGEADPKTYRVREPREIDVRALRQRLGMSQVAFAGRSNVGKSSLLNSLVRQNGLARTSNTPGRTQELNFFFAENVPLYLVDMPGYGFAKAPKEKVTAWKELVSDYLKGRTTLARVFLLIDARHGLKLIDEQIMEILDLAAVSYQAVLTKVDKIKSETLADLMVATTKALMAHPAAFPHVVTTSSEKGTGIADLREHLAQ